MVQFCYGTFCTKGIVVWIFQSSQYGSTSCIRMLSRSNYTMPHLVTRSRSTAIKDNQTQNHLPTSQGRLQGIKYRLAPLTALLDGGVSTSICVSYSGYDDILKNMSCVPFKSYNRPFRSLLDVCVKRPSKGVVMDNITML
ncbi:hypothetical protein CBL_11037 [Carabus blaptoides fortunei]